VSKFQKKNIIPSYLPLLVHLSNNVSNYPRPISLSSLSPREAVADGINCAVTGFHRTNVELFNSAFIGEHVIFELLAGGRREKIFEGLYNLRSQALEHTGPMNTTHMLSSV
jgi:hypothetical protein